MFSVDTSLLSFTVSDVRLTVTKDVLCTVLETMNSVKMV